MRLVSSLALFAALLLALPARAQTVADLAARGECSTAGLEGLSRQLAEAQMCLRPGAFVEFAPHAGITLTSSRIHPYLQASARDALWAAAARTPIRVNSAFRTLADQYVLYHSGGCGLAAEPGRSNHQTGRAVDVADYASVRSSLERAGCTWLGSSDPVHFDCPGTDRRSDAILAFQRLWNANHPEDRIDEDGLYGPQTASRLGRSPARGFATGACAPPPPVNTPPRGALEGATCERVWGWAEDPDATSMAIGAHVYIGGPAGDAAAHGFSLMASAMRASPCSEACSHGFELGVPRGFLDGVARPVFAYAIDSAGGDNTLLGGAPMELRCDRPALPVAAPDGVLRHVTSEEVMAAWSFDALDVLVLPDDVLAEYEVGDDWASDPLLVRAEGESAVYLLDGAQRRHVTSPDAMAAWRFSFDAVEPRAAADVEAIALGPELLPRPWLLRGSGPEVYVLDVSEAAPPIDGGALGPDGGIGSEGGTRGATIASGCAVTPGRASHAWWLLALGAAALVRRRTTSRRRTSR